MKFKDLITNLMGSTVVMVILFYLFVDWFFGMATGEPNFSHFIDMIIYPFMALIWMLISRGKPFTKLVIWSNRVAFVVIVVVAFLFVRDLNRTEGEYVQSDRQVTEITESNTKYFIQLSDTLTYYIDKNDTTNYDTVSFDGWTIYQFVRQDMFKDTVYGSLYLGNGKEYEYLKSINNR